MSGDGLATVGPVSNDLLPFPWHAKPEVEGTDTEVVYVQRIGIGIDRLPMFLRT